MALQKVGLGTVTRVALGSTATVLTVGSAKTCYIRSIICHNIDTVNSSTIKVHIVPVSGGSPGTASSDNQLAQLTIQPTDTYFFELAYPITLASTDDTIQVYNSSTTDAINVLILGDKEV
jgi:FtsP/CotA-like multicopper oxidase with cupredoxin domain